jgi:RNA polymerase nonessential primary-like sigma factor
LGETGPEAKSEIKPIDAYRTKPGRDTMQAVIKELQPSIDAAVKHYAGTDNPIIRQRAKLLAVKAVKSFDPTLGANLKTHVSQHLQELRHTTSQIQEPLALPRQLRQDRGAVLRAIDDIQNNLGREASDEEIADSTGLPVKRVVKVRAKMRQGVPLSVIENQDENDEDDSSYDHVQNASTPEQDWLDAVYHDLGDIDRLILQYRTGYRNAPELSNQEIAKRLKLSPSAVSQRAARIQARLDQFYE